MQTDAYLQAIVPLPAQLEATVGGRVARTTNQGVGGFPAATFDFGDTQYADELGLAWKPLKPLRVFARYEDNFRFAKVDEFTATAGAPCKTSQPLCTQTGKSYELGSEWKAARWSAALSLYRLDLNNEIAFDPTVGFFGGNANLPPTRRDGQTMRLSWQALDALQLSASVQHVDARVQSGALAGKNVPMVASQSGLLAADVDLPWWALVLRTEVLATGPRAFAGDFNNTLGSLAGYVTTNLVLSRNTGAWQFSARVNNLFDADYSEYGAQGFPPPTFAPAQTFYPSPGINGLLTVRYVYQ
jgi:iron complex outermembrane receptor protein